MPPERGGYIPPEALSENNQDQENNKDAKKVMSRREALKTIGAGAAALGVTAAAESSSFAAMLKKGGNPEQLRRPEQKEGASKYKIEVFGTTAETKEEVVHIIRQYIERTTKDGNIQATPEQLASIRGGQTLVAAFGEFAMPTAQLDPVRDQIWRDSEQTKDRAKQDAQNKIPTSGAGGNAQRVAIDAGIKTIESIFMKKTKVKEKVQGVASNHVYIPYKLGMGGSSQANNGVNVEFSFDPQKRQYQFKKVILGYGKDKQEFAIPASLGTYFTEQQGSRSMDMPTLETIQERLKRLVVQFAVDDAEHGAHTVLGKALQEFAVSTHNDAQAKRRVRERPPAPVTNQESVAQGATPAGDTVKKQQAGEERPTRTQVPIKLPVRKRE